MPPRIFYYAPVSSDRLNGLHGTFLDVPAVRNKVLGVCSALKAAGRDAIVVSSVVPGPLRRLFSQAEDCDDHPVPMTVVPVAGRFVVKRMTAGLALLLFTLRTVRRGDRVVLYNFFPEYVFAALALRLAGNPAILDVEDGPIVQDKDLSSRVTRIAYSILDRLCARRRLTVSHQLARRMGFDTYMPVYGVADYFDAPEPAGDRFFGEELHVSFGGNIMPGTGSDLFAATLRRIVRDHPEAALHFHLTGHYDAALFADLAHAVNGVGRLRLSLHGLVPAATYRALAAMSAVGLCLKLPSHSVGQTTFPSKVVEIAATGMLLLSTDVSDMRMVFDDETAVILETEAAEELAARLVWIEGNRQAAARRAAAGRQRVRERLSSAAVGAALGAFLFD